MDDLTTIDGVKFCWGMTLVNESGSEFVLCEKDFEIIGNRILSKNDAFPRIFIVGIFYSSQDARIQFQIKRLELFKSFIDKDLKKLKAGVKPGLELPYLQASYRINEIFEILTPQNCSWLQEERNELLSLS